MLLTVVVSAPALASRPPDCLPAEFVVFFDAGAAELTDTGVKTLGNILVEWRKYRGMLLVIGHTNRTEEKAAVADLGLRRAKAIGAWLSTNGADARAVWLQDRRASMLILPTHPDDAHNSRAHIEVTKGGVCERADRERAEWARQNCLGPADWALNAQACNDVLNDIGRGFR